MLNAELDTLCATIKKAGSMGSYLGLQVTCVLGVFHSMGSRLAALAVQPHTLKRGPQQHKFVYAAADMRQQDFLCRLADGGASNAHRESVLLASSRDKALKYSSLVHTLPHFFLDQECMDGSGSRAGSCSTSLCCHPENFATLDCSAASCSDSDRHDYVCSSPAVIACLQRLFNNEAWDTAPEVIVRSVVAKMNNNRNIRTLEVKTLVGP